MSKSKSPSILLVFEFIIRKDKRGNLYNDPEFDKVEKCLKKLSPDVKIAKAGGIIKSHAQGHSLKRFINLLWMMFACPFEILRSGSDLIFVKTTPPTIQIYYGFWGKLFGRKTVLWMMDYHPVIGTRQPENFLAKHIWNFLSWLDKKALRKYDMIICLDAAMESVVLSRYPEATTCTIPTWSLEETEYLDLSVKGDKIETLKLLYSGSLSMGHTFDALENVLNALVKKGQKVEISYCGSYQSQADRFDALAKKCGVGFRKFPRVENYQDLGKMYKENEINYGVAILDENLYGLVSPSKFGGYISFGLPLFYLGSKDTNACNVCDKFGAGISFSPGADVGAVSDRLMSADEHRKCVSAVPAAKKYFSSDLADDVAKELLKLL